MYVYDPADALPTIGGPLCCGPLPSGISSQDQRRAEARNDVLVFTTAMLKPFRKSRRVIGWCNPHSRSRFVWRTDSPWIFSRSEVVAGTRPGTG